MNSDVSSPALSAPVRRESTVHFIAFIVVVCTAALAGWLIYDQLVVGRGPFDWDEAVHGMQGSLFAHSMQQGNWSAFLFDSYRLVLYPPIYAWGVGLSLLVMGHSVQAVCLVSLISFVLMVPGLYSASHSLHKEYPMIAGGVAAVLLLGSSALIRFATQAMLEMSGLLFLSATILVYLKITRENSPPRAYALLGLAVALTYFVRIHYGVLIFIVLFITIILDSWSDYPSLYRRILYFMLPLIIIFGLWFAYPAKLFSTLRWLVNTSNIDDPYSVSGWLFYPQATVRLAGSVWMFILYFCTLSIAIIRFWKDQTVRFLLLIVVVQLLLAMVHHNRQDRYLFPILPPIFLLTGSCVADLYRLHQNAPRNIPLRLAAWGLPLLIILHSTMLFFSALGEPPVASTRNLDSARQVAQIVREMGTVLIIGTRDIHEPAPPLLDWYLTADARVLEAPQAGSVAKIEEERRISRVLSRLPLPDRLADPLYSMLRADLPDKTRTVYVGLSEQTDYSQSQSAFESFFRETYENSASFQGVIVITAPSRCSQHCLEYVAPALESSGLQQVETIQIEGSYLRVDIYIKLDQS
jgi:4-amino-4-deoxy-L-arabinose transferase-like glycosyltransferase